MNPLVSVIVPLYNVYKYLENCITSIMRQTYQNLEIILIDDGSTDGSEILAENLAVKDKRIKVIHQGNQGVSVARNNGLREATGEYICFVDADDEVSETYVSTLYSLISDESVDLSIISMYKADAVENKVYTMLSTEAINAMFDMNSGIKTVPWGKLFKKSIIEREKILFPIGIKCGEDMLFCYQYMLNATRISYLQCNRSDYYRYVYRDTGVFGHKQYDTEISHKMAYDILLERDKGILNDDSIKEINQRRAHMSLHMILYYWGENHEFNNDLRKEILDNTKPLYEALGRIDKCIYWMIKYIPHLFYGMYLLIFRKIGSSILHRSNMKKVFDRDE